MPWCRVTISYGPTSYSQNYKRQLAVHSHPLSQQFTQAALADALGRINASLPQGAAAATQNNLGISNQADQLGADPGPTYKAI